MSWNGVDQYSPVPHGACFFDGFADASLEADRWGTATTTGTVAVTEAAGYLQIAYTAGGTAGYGKVTSQRRFGWQTAVVSNFAFTTGSGGGDGDHAEGYLTVYKDATHYIKFGGYRDTSEGTNRMACLRYNMGSGETVLDTAGTAMDAASHMFGIVILDNHAVLYLDNVVVYDIPTTNFTNYYVQMEGIVQNDADSMVLRFYDIKVLNSPNISITDNSSLAAAISNLDADVANVDGDIVTAQADITTIKNDITTLISKETFSGTLTLTNTTPSEIEFDTATHGSQFEIIFAAALDGADIPKAFMHDEGTGDTDYTDECNTLTTRDIVILPAAPANDDYFCVMAAEKFCYIDVYMEGGVQNTDNTFDIQYWNGAAWASIAGETDGTSGGTAGRSFYQSGRVSFAAPVDWATKELDGYTGYAVRFIITSAGSDVPLATHIQLGYDDNTGFEHCAAFMSTLTVSIKRYFPTIGYQTFPGDTMTYIQCTNNRDIDINGYKCAGKTKLVFQLSETPSKNVSIPYFGFTRKL